MTIFAKSISLPCNEVPNRLLIDVYLSSFESFYIYKTGKRKDSVSRGLIGWVLFNGLKGGLR